MENEQDVIAKKLIADMRSALDVAEKYGFQDNDIRYLFGMSKCPELASYTNDAKEMKKIKDWLRERNAV